MCVRNRQDLLKLNQNFNFVNRLVKLREGELVFNAIFQPYLVLYGGQFPQLEEQLVPGSDSAAFVSNWQPPLMGFEPEPQRRGASISWGEVAFYAIFNMLWLDMAASF